MSFYLVFGSIKRPIGFMGEKALDWGQPPIGVYNAPTPEVACQAAARDNGTMATYFAVEGTPWGVDLYEAPAKQLGRTEGPNERMSRILDRMEANDKLLAELTKGERDPKNLTREERIALAEERSAEMEREAGLDGND